MLLDIIKTLETGQGRFELCHQVFKAIRVLHKPGNRIQDTAYDALRRLAGEERQQISSAPANVNDAAIEVRQESVAPESQVAASQLGAIGDIIEG